MRPVPAKLVLAIALSSVVWLSAQAQTAKQEPAKTSHSVHSLKAGKSFHDCPNCPEMVVIPAGSFDMGSPDSEEGRNDDEGPLHKVNVADFAMGKTEITRGQFAEFVSKTSYDAGDKCWTLEERKYKEREGRNWREPGYVQDDNHPAVCINWDDASAYAEWMSHKTGKHYRLPTEAEWEYASRGNTSTARYWGDNPDEACRYANGADKTTQAQVPGAAFWLFHNCTDEFAYTAPVGRFEHNAFGLHDMLGNVAEWVADNYHESYTDAPADGSAWLGDGERRVLRGGSWNNDPNNMRAAIRNRNKPGLRLNSFGFRLARDLP